MKCDRCQTSIAAGEEKLHFGQTLCEDCYMDALSPVRACDPWAIHSAKTLEQATGGSRDLTPLQDEILVILEATGGLEPKTLRNRLSGQPSLKEIEREFAALRHMEKARAEKRGERIYWRLW